MPIDRVDTLLDALEESLLLTPAQLDECRRRQESFPDTRSLARHLLQRDWLTPYQVNHVLQGRAGELLLDTYVLLERIGQGGMGQVFKARHRLMNRVVALKVIRQERLSNPDLVRRFRREIQAAAQLTHPNIVIAYDANQVGATYFMVMEYVEGTDLARHVEKNGRLPVAQACEYIRQAARGLQHAHERGLVHRDIKPANLLLSVKDNTVKVLDMGLARLNQTVESDLTAAGLTQEGSVMGTPDYMAPEQAEESSSVDTRADVYSLGCSLYFLLSGAAPFAGGTLAQKLRKHATAEPAALDSFRPDVPAGLAAVVRKMMAKRPEDRYQTPGEVAAALEPFCHAGPVAAIPVAAAAPTVVAAARPVAVPLSDETMPAAPLLAIPAAVPVEAPAQPAGETVPTSGLDSVPSVTVRAPGAGARLRDGWRRLGRRGQVVALVVVVLLVLGVILALWPRHPSPHPPPKPEPVGLFKLTSEPIPSEERRHWHPAEFDDMLVAVLGESRARLPGLSCIALRPDGKKLAFGGSGGFLADAETLHRDNDEHGLTLKGPSEYGAAVTCLAFSADGKLLITGSNDKTVRVWDGSTGEALGGFDEAHDGAVTAVAVTRDGKYVLSASDDATVRVWDLATRKRVGLYKGHTTPVRAVAVTPDGKYAFSAAGASDTGQSADRDVRMWEVKTASDAAGRPFTGHDGRISQLSVSRDGKRLLGAGSSKNAWVWELADPDRPRALGVNTPSAGVGAAFLPDGRVATCGAGGVVQVWEVPEGHDKPPRPLFLSPEALASGGTPALACYPDNRRVAFIAGNTVRVWDIDKVEEWHAPRGHQAAVTHLALGGGRWLLSAGADRQMRLWDLETGQQQGDAWGIPSNQNFSAVAVSPDGKIAYSATGTETVKVWETKPPHRPLRDFTAPKGFAFGPIALSPDATRLLTADKQLWLWDPNSPEPVRRFDGPPTAVRQLGYLADEDHPRRAFTFDGSELRVWKDVEKSEEFQKFPVGGSVVAVAPGGDPIYAGQGDGGLLRWHDLGDPHAKARPFENRHAPNAVTALALAPDGGRLFSAGAGHLVWWELTPERARFEKEWDFPGGINALLFAPDGRHLIVANGNTTVYVLRLPEK
jgi:serine/threonine-protein kinase